MTAAEAGALAMLVAADRKTFLLQLQPGEAMQTHNGILQHDALIGRAWGDRVESHLGRNFYLLEPTLRDLLPDTQRRSQIMFPKDSGYILLRLSIRPGLRALEAGTGSGAITTALVLAVGAGGQVITVDRRADMQQVARENLDRAGLTDRVIFLEGEAETVDLETVQAAQALFLDIPDPQLALPNLLPAIEPGSEVGSILPSANQVSSLLDSMQRMGFGDIEVCEPSLRFYKTVPPAPEADGPRGRTHRLPGLRPLHQRIAAGDAVTPSATAPRRRSGRNYAFVAVKDAA